MSAISMTSSAWRRTLVAGVAAVSLASALPAAAGPMPVASAAGLTAQPEQSRLVPAVADGDFDGAQIVKVRNGRNATAAAIVGGIAALGVGAAIASQNRSYGGGYGGGYYAQPQGYYAAPQQGYYAPAATYYEAPQTYVYEEPAPVYVDPAPAYAPAYGYTYAPRPSVRHHAGGPGKRQIDSFRDSYR
ncbi:hypothetical protein [uncultured Alsobacter sp.]|uniref:hypothetical protein n=1 Tax=uncultured Alsobacter sp. TaxID=1748258 RepID=UPI0025DFB9AB|nr:hypothetical protein [uncultured Alsobacter sp.]